MEAARRLSGVATKAAGFPTDYLLVPRRLDLSSTQRIILGLIRWCEETGWDPSDAEMAGWLGVQPKTIRNTRWRLRRARAPIDHGIVRVPVEILRDEGWTATQKLVAAEVLRGADLREVMSRVGIKRRAAYLAIAKVKESAMVKCIVPGCPGRDSIYRCKHKQGVIERDRKRQPIQQGKKDNLASKIEVEAATQTAAVAAEMPGWFTPFAELIRKHLGGIKDVDLAQAMCKLAIQNVGRERALRTLQDYLETVPKRYFKLSNWASEPLRYEREHDDDLLGEDDLPEEPVRVVRRLAEREASDADDAFSQLKQKWLERCRK